MLFIFFICLYIIICISQTENLAMQYSSFLSTIDGDVRVFH